ncbi:TonB-dependent receptor [Chitinophaga sedimenti]|uniref:TonB-dependent receptor n=1 Tax=Chitinophaga sedimenti TaxID=2033606 RepID=UPI0020061FA7|nr:TonB-dependent receptor [Chitinophaga sedimenti]MCK7554831.1 TonB-dependent receptor [Chitinophaga sedimenti]
MQVGKTTATAISFTPPEHTSFDNRSVYERGRYTESQTSSFNYAVNAMLTYARVFRGVHSVNATARAEGQETNNRRTSFTAVGYPAGTNGNPSFSFGYDELGKPAYSASRFRRNNLLASLNYAYDNRYMIDASLRYDGSTAFGSNKKYASFWSVGGGWNIHRETWFKQFSWLEFLKIRANVGLTGNQNFGSLRSTSVYNYESYVNLFGQALSLQAMGNPNLEWQNTLSSSGGIDFAFWKNRLNGSFNVYKNIPIPSSL